MNVYYKTSGDAQWEEFKKRISDGKEEDEDMTLDTFKELMKEYRAELQDNDCGTWRVRKLVSGLSPTVSSMALALR